MAARTQDHCGRNDRSRNESTQDSREYPRRRALCPPKDRPQLPQEAGFVLLASHQALPSDQRLEPDHDDASVPTVVQQIVRQPKRANGNACRNYDPHGSPAFPWYGERVRLVAYTSLTGPPVDLPVGANITLNTIAEHKGSARKPLPHRVR